MAMYYFIGTVVLYAIIAGLVILGLVGLANAIIADRREAREAREAAARYTRYVQQEERIEAQRADHWRQLYHEALQAKWKLAIELGESAEKVMGLEADLDEQYGFVQGLEMDLDDMKARFDGLQKDFDGQLETDRAIINGQEANLERAYATIRKLYEAEHSLKCQLNSANATIRRYQEAAWLKDMEKVAANQPTWDLTGGKFIQYCDTCGCNPCKCVY